MAMATVDRKRGWVGKRSVCNVLIHYLRTSSTPEALEACRVLSVDLPSICPTYTISRMIYVHTSFQELNHATPPITQSLLKIT
eukprot:2437073-Amphidinium_carterae.1